MRGLIKLLLFLSLLSGTAFADFPPLRVEEKDGFPNGTATKLKFDNGTVSKSGTTFSIKTGNPFNQTLNTTTAGILFADLNITNGVTANNFTATDIITASSYTGNGSNLTGIPNNATVNGKGNANYSFAANNFVGTGWINASLGNFSATVAASSFIGNGSNLTGIPNNATVNAKGISNFTCNQDTNTTNSTTFGTINITNGLTVDNITCTNAIRAGGTSNITALNITGGITAANFTGVLRIATATINVTSGANVGNFTTGNMIGTAANFTNGVTVGNLSSSGAVTGNGASTFTALNVTNGITANNMTLAAGVTAATTSFTSANITNGLTIKNITTTTGGIVIGDGQTLKIASNWTLPITNGSNTQVLKSNGDGTVSWAADAQGAGGNSLYINESATAKGSTVSANVSIVFDKEDFNLSAGDEVNITFNHTMTDLWNAKGTSNFTANQDLNSTNATTFGTVNITSGLTVGNISCTNAIRAGGTSNITALNITGGITAQNFTAIANINGATLGSDASVSDVELRYLNNTTSNLVDQFAAKLAITDTGGSLTALNGGNVSSDGILLHNQTKSLSIYNITDQHDILMWKTVKAITIIDVRTVCTGGTSVTGTIAECNATGQLCANSNATWVTAAGTQATNGTMTDAAYDANDWVMWNTTATSGTPSNFAITITYNE